MVKKIRDELGVTVLLIEHDMKLVMGLCERIFVWITVKNSLLRVLPQKSGNDPKVIAAYLGEAV